jgi:hypothetical protein
MFTNLSTPARADALALMTLHGYTMEDIDWLIEYSAAFDITADVALADTLSAWESANADDFEGIR